MQTFDSNCIYVMASSNSQWAHVELSMEAGNVAAVM